MFLAYYNLIEQPFGVSPDPRFLYFNHMYRETLASLWYGIKQGRGFMALVAQPGMGKTTLLFQLLQRLRSESARTVFLFQTCCGSVDLIRYLLQDLGIFPAPDLASMHQQLNDALVREASAGKQFVFVIDEAQNLSPSVLETVRLLSDFETPQGKLLQIILAGQPDLLHTLNRPGMLQLRQRISVTTSLDPLEPEEVAHYVEHRLGVAGYQGPPLFSRGALEVIGSESHGIPRNINNLCFGALSAAFALQQKKIGREIVEEVAADQDLSKKEDRIEKHWGRSEEHSVGPVLPSAKPSPHPSTWFSWQVRRAAYLATVAGLLMLAGLILWSRRPTPVSHGFAGSNPVTASAGASRHRGIETPTAGMVRPASEIHLSAVLPKDGTVTVERGQTLRQICLLYIGAYSTSIVQQIQAINPELVDPNRLEVGQQIRLHFGAPGSGSIPDVAKTSVEPKVASLGK